jgi:g-D-glutamyl-meso-diaminopimelate peptidase
MPTKNKKIIGVLLTTGLIIFAAGLFMSTDREITETDELGVPVAEPELTPIPSTNKIVGTSVEGRIIETYTYGTGSTTLLFVGGVHGGYEWNSTLLAYDFIDELESGTFTVPSHLRFVIIPTLNPDGLFEVVGKSDRFLVSEIPPNDAHTTGRGRFNKNGVDLNRNFDCKWQPESTWRSRVVSAGTAPFSEPEAQTLKRVVENERPSAVVFWHSQANTVYASECEAGVLPQTLTIMKAYADAANYNSVASFDAYPVSGDAEGWLASIGIPAITVELETRTSSEWQRNQAGIKALVQLY